MRKETVQRKEQGCSKIMFRSYFEKYEMAAAGTLGNRRTQRQMWMLGANKSNAMSKAPLNHPDHIELYKKRVEDDCVEILEQLEKTYRCLECGEHYKGSDNLGRWQCRGHRGHFNRAKGAWKCCGGDEIALGCTRADHVSSAEPLTTDDVHLHMPVWLIQRLAVPVERISVVKHDNPLLTRAIVHRIENSLY